MIGKISLEYIMGRSVGGDEDGLVGHPHVALLGVFLVNGSLVLDGQVACLDDFPRTDVYALLALLELTGTSWTLTLLEEVSQTSHHMHHALTHLFEVHCR